MMLTVLWVVLALAALYLYFQQRYSFFSRHGVKTLPCFPLIGNLGPVMLRREHLAEHFIRSYFAFTKERFIGRYDFLSPSIFVRDIELLKKITIKDFDHFVDHASFGKAYSDPMLDRILIALKGQEWRDMRSTLSPAFTSSKIRVMVPLMIEAGDQMIETLKLKIKETGKGYAEIDAKDLTARYATDVIASCAFGLKTNTHNDDNNQFYVVGKQIFDFDLKKIVIILGFLAFPKLMKYFNLTYLPKEVPDFYRNTVLGTMKHREENHIIRPDMIHLLMEAKKGSLKHDDDVKKEADAGFATVEESHVGRKTVNRTWTDDDLVAQAVLFLLAGFETVSSGMTFLLHELAMNPDVQEKLVEEIKENHAKNDGKFDYKSIQEMTYLDMVISETLRRWPPAVALERLCTKDYNCGKPNSEAKEDFILRKGTAVSIPTWAFHLDPDFFPDPYKFDPERFSEENKHTINAFAYGPFGHGPRNCIGSRFALCEMKVMAYQLLLHMEVSPGEKTCISAELDLNSVTIRLKGGHWVRFRVRE